MINKIYITTMYRWGNRENHSYVLYAGFDENNAIAAGNNEHLDRGRKYSPEVLEFTPDEPESQKCIVPLK